METVRLLKEHEFPAEQQKYFEATKAWFNIDYLPKMSKVLSYQPEMSHTHGRCSRRAMVDSVLQRRQKEMIAVAVSAINACDY
jgi:alkylhydroperoxidase/carboxymuconolactone decarboxylase family protein YurZ